MVEQMDLFVDKNITIYKKCDEKKRFNVKSQRN